MIIEHVLCPVIPGLEAEYEAALRTARPLIEASPGFISLRLSREIEGADASSSTYLMLIEWQSVDDHRVGFRESAAYPKWQALLHHFYEPFPTVEYFQPVS